MTGETDRPAAGPEGGARVRERHEVSVGPGHGSIALVEEAGGTVLVLAGEIDTIVIAEFERSWGTALTPVVAIDVGEVTLLSATAVDLMLRHLWTAAAAGAAPVLRRSNPHVERVLELLGLAGTFPRPPGSA
jgi:anti-anti-sigma regulatory factor